MKEVEIQEGSRFNWLLLLSSNGKAESLERTGPDRLPTPKSSKQASKQRKSGKHWAPLLCDNSKVASSKQAASPPHHLSLARVKVRKGKKREKRAKAKRSEKQKKVEQTSLLHHSREKKQERQYRNKNISRSRRANHCPYRRHHHPLHTHSSSRYFSRSLSSPAFSSRTGIITATFPIPTLSVPLPVLTCLLPLLLPILVHHHHSSTQTIHPLPQSKLLSLSSSRFFVPQ